MKVLDTSTAFRTDTAWDYGFPELKGQKEKIKNSYRVAVPGCYASGFISIARPLVELGLARRTIPSAAPAFPATPAAARSLRHAGAGAAGPDAGGYHRRSSGRLADYYKDAATVKVHALNEPLPENGLYSNAMAGTDRMELYMTVNAAGDQMMLVSLFDNLGKGSSGAAVQCMNLMLGLEETEGLE